MGVTHTPEQLQRAKEMRELSAADRHAAIAASSNVVGFGRFVFRHVPRS